MLERLKKFMENRPKPVFTKDNNSLRSQITVKCPPEHLYQQKRNHKILE